MYYNISETDIYLFHQGTNYYSYKMLGCHHILWKGQLGFRFSTWAPHAKKVSVVGDFNNWNPNRHQLHKVNNEGLWIGFFTDVPEAVNYKYAIITADGQEILKADPYAFYSELRPNTASITTKASRFHWTDKKWRQQRKKFNPYSSPISIYEVHLGTWKKKEGKFYTYRELAHELIPYVKKLGFTHIELLPLSEHPFDLSWGYQITGYYSVTSRYGTPEEFKYFVDQCHQHNIGVIMDWVPGHFCKDAYGLRQFDGQAFIRISRSTKS